ncbi:MAG: choice-of-anchor B family protein [Gammaproteobacteria bacterium]|nr:choice-of-anchor B family protein [Gammaproteobacteria bacterium]
MGLVSTLAACGGSSGSDFTSGPPSPPPPPPPSLSTGPEVCTDGDAGEFSCSGVDLRSRLPISEMDGVGGNDIWGWFDSQTGREYALMGLRNGTAFVDISDPENPAFLGRLPTQTTSSTWRDIKVYQDHAYIVADAAGAHGMQVFDLTRLRGVTDAQAWQADMVYGDFQNAHNLAINEASGFAYAVGTDTCSGGLHMIDLGDPVNPMFAGCHEVTPDTHDAQCVLYQGPDANFTGREICVNSNENHVGVADVSNKSAPVRLSPLVTYPQLGFVHQAWLTEDHRFLFVGDELDELNFGVPTRTHVFDVSDLASPQYLYAYEATTTTIDHNLYVLGNRLYQANYNAGLRVLEFGDLVNQEIAEVAFFDTVPASGVGSFDGAWSVYPYLPSGTIIVSDGINGLFILTLQP